MVIDYQRGTLVLRHVTEELAALSLRTGVRMKPGHELLKFSEAVCLQRRDSNSYALAIMEVLQKKLAILSSCVRLFLLLYVG